MIEDHIKIAKSDRRGPIKRHNVSQGETEMGLCVVSRARQINSSVFQKTVTSISLMVYNMKRKIKKNKNKGFCPMNASHQNMLADLAVYYL